MCVYYAAADFHLKTFEHKFSEVVHILMALGATRFTVHYECRWGREMAANFDVTGNPAANADASLGRKPTWAT